ncbi:hypothetical protein [Streptomyces sp. NPDC101237]|uniref:hypothetical protein n=1 Tax=Streptomyces sp. NPDC101237 TaxID=3366139 RepID=UPI003816C752
MAEVRRRAVRERYRPLVRADTTRSALRLTRTGRTFDGTGIPRRISEPVFTAEEVAKGRDSALDRAVALLRRGC